MYVNKLPNVVTRKRNEEDSIRTVVLSGVSNALTITPPGPNPNKNVRWILVRGSMPPCRLRQRKFWKYDYEMMHSEVLKNALFCMFSPFNFSSIFPGGQLTPLDAHGPQPQSVILHHSCTNSSPIATDIKRTADDVKFYGCNCFAVF